MPGTRTRFRPSPTASSSAARSPGVHTAPRQKTRTPLTQRSRESLGAVLDGAEADPARPPRRRRSRRGAAACRGCAATRARRRGTRVAPAVDLDHAGRALEPGPQPGADPRAGDQRDRPVRARPPADRARSRAPGRAAGCAPSAAGRPRPASSASAAAACVGSVSSSSVSGCTTMRTSWSPASTGTSCRSNIDRPEADDRAVDQQVPDGGDAADLEDAGASAVQRATNSWRDRVGVRPGLAASAARTPGPVRTSVRQPESRAR